MKKHTANCRTESIGCCVQSAANCRTESIGCCEQSAFQGLLHTTLCDSLREVTGFSLGTQGCRGRDHMVVEFNTTSVVSSNPAQARCTRYNIM